MQYVSLQEKLITFHLMKRRLALSQIENIEAIKIPRLISIDLIPSQVIKILIE